MASAGLVGRCAPLICSFTTPMKRRPFFGMVRMSFCSLPLSPIAFRAALMRLSSVDSAPPYEGNEIVSADDVVAVLQQMDQQVEYLRLHRNQLTVPAQLAKAGVQSIIVEAEFHARCRIFSQETIKSVS